ncbi:hypothetical protein LA316_05175 [Enterobacter bugandensis]|nr:hypothetical protein LA316_05175 [Enterobacter bugandensis]UBI00698.1 hypothetical protein LA326_04355 [Enterobacter bugandensis]
MFKSLRGMGPCIGQLTLTALCDNRKCFNRAEEIRNWKGIASVTGRSGKNSECTGVGVVRNSYD